MVLQKLKIACQMLPDDVRMKWAGGRQWEVRFPAQAERHYEDIKVYSELDGCLEDGMFDLEEDQTDLIEGNRVMRMIQFAILVREYLPELIEMAEEAGVSGDIVIPEDQMPLPLEWS